MTQILDALRPLAVAVDGLHPDPANARTHDQRNLDAIKASLAKFGQRKPIVVQRQGMIVRAGNGTLAAAKALGWTEIAARRAPMLIEQRSDTSRRSPRAEMVRCDSTGSTRRSSRCWWTTLAAATPISARASG